MKSLFVLLCFAVTNNAFSQVETTLVNPYLSDDYEVKVKICADDKGKELEKKIKMISIASPDAEFEYKMKDGKIKSFSFTSDKGACSSDNFGLFEYKLFPDGEISCRIGDRDYVTCKDADE